MVGASESLNMSNNAVLPMLEDGRDVFLVNPTRSTVYGRPTYPDLAAIGVPVDAVLALVNAERAVGVVEQAAAVGCGGVVVAAAGFEEAGDKGRALQERLREVASSSGVAVVGPNCSGFKNVPLKVNLFTGGRIELAPGGLSIVSQSGFLTRSAMAAARERRLGVGLAISSGNEAVCDLADYVGALAEDEGTSVICLVIEKIRRSDEFFRAVARARSAGKAVLALKLGHSERARAAIRSHTGAIAQEAWVYEIALREHGVVPVRDLDALLDAAQLLAQIPPDRRREGQRVAVITTSGGVAALATDVAEEEGVDLPAFDDVAPRVREHIPGSTLNPLDLTGFVMGKPEIMEEVFTAYGDAADLLVLAWWVGEGDEDWSRTLLEPFAAAASRSGAPFVVTTVEERALGEWIEKWRTRGLAFSRGLRATFRAAHALSASCAPVRLPTKGLSPGSQRPPALLRTAAGPIVPFAAAMEILRDVGISVAPYVVLRENDAPGRELEKLGSRLVVKLADVPHRTELGAVVVDVAVNDVPDAVAQLRSIALREGVPATVVVQPMVRGRGEAFAGLLAESDVGPIVLFGPGGVLVEVAGPVAGRLAPPDELQASALVGEVANRVFRLRGHQPWPQPPLVRTVLGLGELWRRHGTWLTSVDVNPLVVTESDAIAVDALLVASPAADAEDIRKKSMDQ